VDLLERESQLARLGALLTATERGEGGACVLVSGEAGIGKTSFVRHFTDLHRERCELLWGACEALFTPRPLGPLADIADALPPALAARVHEGHTHNGLFPALLALLRDRKKPVVLVLEDVHWADGATLDLTKYLGRRVHAAPALLILTFRDDELGLEHPLRKVLGELPADSTHRLPLPLLSEHAVEHLAKQAGRSSRGLFRATDGNPFFVTEALESDPGEIPSSVRDAVLARIAGLSTPAREVAEVVSIAPSRVERVLVKTLLGSVATALDECLDRGVLRAEGGWLAFRHELARQSVEQSLPPGRFITRHAEMFRALRGRGEGTAELSRLVHHAERAGLVSEVARLAPVAAAGAAKASAHREAAALYALALQHTDGLEPRQRAELLEARAHSCALTNLLDQAIDARLAALSLRRQLGDSLAEGINLRWLAHLYRFHTGELASLTYARAAVQVLETLPPQRELAFAYTAMTWTSTLGETPAAAVTWGDRAVALAEQLDDAEALAAALNARCSARLRTHDDPVAWAELKGCLALALENKFEEPAARAFMSLMTLALMHRQLQAALDYAQQGIAYCAGRDLDLYTARLYVRRAFAYIELGRWQEAASDLAELDHASTITPLERETSRFLRAVLNLRRGQPDVTAALQQLHDSAPRLPLYSWYARPANACAEAAWLQGDSDAVERVANPALAAAIGLGEPWRLGELAVWLKRAGRLPYGFDHPVAHPHALELAGDWRAAAAEWNRLGCPYEQGLAMLAGDEAALRGALRIFDALGAAPAATIVRQRLHALGARDVQRGPQPRTRTDPHGLTRREREILDLLVQRLSNRAIARKLHRSERTVEHHVSALLGKLGAGSRAEVIGLAQRSAPAPRK